MRRRRTPSTASTSTPTSPCWPLRRVSKGRGVFLLYYAVHNDTTLAGTVRVLGAHPAFPRAGAGHRRYYMAASDDSSGDESSSSGGGGGEEGQRLRQLSPGENVLRVWRLAAREVSEEEAAEELDRYLREAAGAAGAAAIDAAPAAGGAPAAAALEETR